ncbi:MAG TPA: ABC transporter permease [Fibrobacteria bacterium]|nr:ABC transporter permease [Fibrobacteria bacterium]
MKILKNLLKSPMFVIGIGLFLGTLFLAFLGPLFANMSLDRVASSYAPPGDGLLLGADNLGRNYVALLLHGLRNSLYVGFLAGIIATTVGTLIGIYGGFKGGIIDDILSVTTNLFIVIPQLIVLILISASLKDGRSLTLIAVIIGATGWTWSARAVRAQSAALKSRDHIALARINGDGTFAILVKHILPYLASYVFMVFIIQIASGILSESAISMLGLGPMDTQSLGIILNDAKANGALGDGIWWGIFPSTILITTIVFSLYLINTSMEGVFNPRLRRE